MPPDLLDGPSIEVWAPGQPIGPDSARQAWKAWRAAFTIWCSAAGIDPYKAAHGPHAIVRRSTPYTDPS